MLAALTEFWPQSVDARTDRPRRVAPFRAPVLMSDILTSRGGEPELLIRWREDANRDDPPEA